MASLSRGLVGGGQFKRWCGLLLEWCIHISETRVYGERERQIFPSKCLQRCKRGCEGPWHGLPHLTDWKQGFIFSNLWSRCSERSVKGRRGEGVPGETLGGEMKDIIQDKLSSANVDESRPANRNKWGCFDLTLTCHFRKPSSVLHSLFLSLSLTSIRYVHYWPSSQSCLTDR